MVDSVIAIDYDKCTGCRICELVCSMKNSGEINPVKSRIRIVRIGTDVTTISFPVLCMQCVEAFCMIICPLGAISEDSITGARIINKDKCIACSACVYACPFGAISVDHTLGHAINCTLCEGKPICVQFCPTNAIQYLHRDEVSIRLRRSSMSNYAAFVRGTPLTGELTGYSEMS